MQAYEFTYVLRGTGESEEEALTGALEAFVVDPGEPTDTSLIDEED